MLISTIKLLLFIASMTGFVLYIEKKLKLQVEFIPLIVIAIITTFLFIGGILNSLLFTTAILFFLGLYFLIKELFNILKEKQTTNVLSKYITPGIIIFAVMSAYFLFVLKDQRLIHYDNFSHWAVIAKNMIIDDALPNFENVTVSFNSYPPGSALFIYYFMKIVGESEGLALFAQMIIILSSLLTLFSFSSFTILQNTEKKASLLKKIIINIIILLVSLYLLDGPSSIHDLLVDTLLNTIGVAMFSIIYYYIYLPGKIYIPLSFLGVILTLIKNSGLFFVFFSLIIYGVSLILYNKRQKNNLFIFLKKDYKLLIPFITPMVATHLWNNHVSMVFPNDTIGKHTMNLELYLNTFKSKSIEEVAEITESFLTILYDNYLSQILVLLFIIFVFMVYSSMINKKIDKRLMIIGFTDLVVFIMYSLGLWIMYLVSMPTAEALMLAGHYRYMVTILNYIFGITAVSMIYYLNKMEFKKSAVVPNVLVFIFFSWLTLSPESIEDTKSLFQREELEIGVTQSTLKNLDAGLSNLTPNPMKSQGMDERYLIYYKGLSNINYENYYLKYRLLHNISSLTESIQDEDRLWEYDYLTITLVTEEIQELFNEVSDLVPEIGTYKIDKENQRVIEK